MFCFVFCSGCIFEGEYFLTLVYYWLFHCMLLFFKWCIFEGVYSVTLFYFSYVCVSVWRGWGWGWFARYWMYRNLTNFSEFGQSGCKWDARDWRQGPHSSPCSLITPTGCNPCAKHFIFSPVVASPWIHWLRPLCQATKKKKIIFFYHRLYLDLQSGDYDTCACKLRHPRWAWDLVWVLSVQGFFLEILHSRVSQPGKWR